MPGKGGPGSGGGAGGGGKEHIFGKSFALEVDKPTAPMWVLSDSERTALNLDIGFVGPWYMRPLDAFAGSHDWFDEVDRFVAGMAHSLTNGLSTRARAGLYGDFATRNHTGTSFVVGQWTGTGVSISLVFVNPCNLSNAAGAAFRGLNAAQGAGGVFNAYENVRAGRYFWAIVDIYGVYGNLRVGGQTCFTAETKLLTREGYRPIGELRQGDWLLSRSEFDPEGPLEEKEVEAVFVRYARVWHLHVGGQVIRTTCEHPCYAHGKGWTQVGQLHVGDWVRTIDGWVQVEDLCDSGLEETVYNLRIADYHTYFVGDDGWGFGVWAHNAYKQGNNLSDDIASAAPGSREHKALRWKEYKDRGGEWGYERWSKQYETNMQNASRGLAREREYRSAWGGESKMLDTPYGKRQIDLHLGDSKRLIQIKSGKEYLTKNGRLNNFDAIKRDAWLVKQGYQVEWILEQGASKQLLDELMKAGIKVHVGPQIF